MRVGRQVAEALQVHHRVGAVEGRRQAIALLAERIPDPEWRVDAYAHQLSGGMRERERIAAGEPLPLSEAGSRGALKG